MIKTIYINIICLLIVLFVTLCIVQTRVNKYTYETGKEINKITIPDIIHDNIPNIDNLYLVNDNFTKSIMFIFALVFIINKQYKYIIFYLLLLILGNFICFIFFISTILPDSSKSCKYSNDMFETIKNMGSCNNLGISAHFISIIIILGLFYKYYGKKYWVLYILTYIISFLLICISRSHYTKDCLTSTFVGLFIIYEFNNIQKGINYIVGNKFFDL
jgi:hypothetical protein